MVEAARSRNGWFVWFSLVFALLLSVASLPTFMQVGRPLWLGLMLAYWSRAARSGQPVWFTTDEAVRTLRVYPIPDTAETVYLRVARLP